MGALLKAAFLAACCCLLLTGHPAGGIAQDDPTAELAAEEARQLQIAGRFQSILVKSPRRGTALDRVYGHHVEFGTLAKFVDDLKQRVQTDPTDGAGWLILGLIESLRGEDANAVEALTQAEQQRADDPLASYYLGQSLLLVGRPEDAVTAFERAIERRPERADLLEVFQQLGRVHQRAQRDEEARDVWTRLEELFPDDPRVLEQIAITLMEEGEYAEALRRFERLVGLVQDDYRKTTFRMQAAELKIRESRRDEGLSDLEGLLSDLNPESWLYRDVRRRIEDIFARSGDQDGLVKYYERWLIAHPQDLDAMARLAKFLAGAARVPEAMQWMDKALNLAPTRVDLRRAFIRELLDDQRYTEAVQQYALLNSAAPGNVDVLREWGRTVLKDASQSEAARRVEASRIWNLIVAAQPDDALTAAQAADLFRQAKLNDEAIALYEKAVSLSPDDPQYREYLGEFRHILDQKEEALAVWREIAAGNRRTALNLTRLAEVLNRFSYPDEAADTIAAAAALDVKDLSLQLQAADYHTQARRHDDALKYVAAAEQLSQNDDEADVILKQKVETLQAADQLEAETAELLARVQSDAAAPAAQWHTLARYYEAEREWTDAANAIQQALDKEPKSIRALTTAARIAELSGDYGRASDLFRELAAADRRSRGDHLTNVARLEAQLGRIDEALQAGRDLIVSAPGNTEHYEFYAQLCFRLGRSEDGIEALRKAVRINPSEPQLITTLAAALAGEFRTDEAIQLYWQAFEKSEELDDQTSLVMKLAELHMQLNQFDRLVERLERDRREEEKRRSMTICLAQAHHSSGDYGTARAELESLLSTDTRDTELLLQLSKLCEAGQDFDAAVDYQRQIVSIAPGAETEYRLAQLLQAMGEHEQATEILAQLLLREEDPARLFRGVDSLLNQATFEAAISVLEPLRRERRDDWELLYREGVAWAGLERNEEAADRFQQLLALTAPIDALGVREEERFKQAQSRAKSDRSRGITAEFPVRPGPMEALKSVRQVRQAVGLDYQRYYGGQTPQTWTPGTYGQARVAAYGWLLKFAQLDGTAETFGKELELAAADDAATRETLINWLYVQQIQNRYAKAFDVLRRLARRGNVDEQQAYLEALPNRGITDENMQRSGNQQKQLPPLPDDELDFAVECLNALTARVNVPGNRSAFAMPNSVTAVVKELRLAERNEQARQLLDDFIGKADSVQTVGALFALCADQEWFEPAASLRTRWNELARRDLAEKKGAASSRMQSRTVLGYVSSSAVRMMGYLGSQKQNDEVLSMLDELIEISIEEARIRRTQRKPRSRPQNQGSQYYQVSYGKQNQHIQIDFPRPNEHLDSGTINILRQAYEVFQRNDVASDLTDHLDQQLAAAKADERVYRLLYKAAVLWWQDEQDDAIAAYAEASDCLPQDTTLRLDLATLYEARSDFDDALAIAEGIVAVDQQLLQTRETLVMQLAERLGDLERARTAAERLFGLRLDTQTQIALSSHMRRLGMHDMAAAVVARADRRSNNQTSSLLLLMTQYQGQGNTALAQQIAFRILQRTQGSAGQSQNRNPTRRGQTQDSQARDQALRVLAQTGALQPQIEQVEQRLEQSPESPRLYEQLIEYYTSLGNRDKVQELLQKAVAQRPNVLSLQFQLGKYLQQNGKPKEACEVYLKLIKARPDWFRDDFYEIRNVFQQAQREKELADLIAGMDLRPFGHPHYVMDIAQNLIRNEATRDMGILLYERCFDQFPSYRSSIVSNLYDPEFWKNERIFELGKKSLIPDEGTAASNPWSGVADSISYSQGGTVNGMFQRMFDGVRGTPREAELRKVIEDGIAKVPAWHGGKALLALLDIRTGKKDAGIAALQALLADEAVFDNMPSNSRWLIGQELDQLEQTKELAIRLFTVAMDDQQNSMSQIQYSPVIRLVRLYGESGEKERARDLLLKTMNARPNNYDPEYQSYLMAENGVFAAGELSKLEMPADAIRVYRDLLLQEDSLKLAGNWYGNQTERFVKQARDGMDRALSSLNAANAEPAIKELLSPQQNRSSSAPVVDLMLMTPPIDELGKRRMESPLIQLLNTLSSNPTIESAITGQVQQLATEYPDDVAVAVTLALWNLSRESESAAECVDRVSTVLAEHPLEELPEGRRPNSRHRAAAAERIPVWLLARECLQRDDLKSTGLLLADEAIAGADRQVEENSLAAILFEWGTTAADAGDLAEAERRWNQLLDYVTRRPQARPKPEEKKTSFHGSQGAHRRFAGFSLVTNREPPGLARRAATGLNPAARMEFVVFLDDAAAAGQPAPENPQQPKLIAPLTVPQFRVTMAIAREAARRKLPELSRRALREALLGGPPVPVGNSTPTQRGGGIMRVPAAGGGISVIQQADTGEGASVEVAESLQSVLALWDPETYPAADVYGVLVPLVFPPNRPGEIMLYPNSSGVDQLRVSSLGATLIEWALRAERLDDVRQQISTRRENPLARLSALVLEARIGLLTDDSAAAEAALRDVNAALAGGSNPETVMIAAHAAVPALERPELTSAAVPVLQRVVEQQIQQISTNHNQEPSISPLARRINSALREQGDVDALKKFYQSYLTCTQAFYVRYSGEYGLWRQMQIVAQLAADAAQNVGPDLALEYLGQVGDVTFTEQGPVSTKVALAAAASRISTRPAEERYALWRDWTLPAENRRTVRMLADSVDPVLLPPEFYPLRDQPDGADLEFLKRHEILSNFTLLIDAAREANALADLKSRVQAAVDEKLPNAEFLWPMVLLAMDDPQAAEAVSEIVSTVRERHKQPEGGRRRQVSTWGDLLVCVAALERPEMYERVLPLADWLMKNDQGGAAAGRSRLVDLLAESQRRRAGSPGTAPEPEFSHWQSLSPWSHAGRRRGWWVVNEGRLARLTGYHSEGLLLQFPLAGDFEFQFERLSTYRNTVNFQFNGTSFNLNNDFLTIDSAGGSDQVNRQRVGLEQRAGGYERLRIVSDGSQVRYYFADHLVYDEPLNRTCPWLVLYGGTGTAVARNLTLSGAPVIPREVPLFDADRMEGWNSSTFGESRRPHRALAEKPPDDPNDYRYQQRMELPNEFVWEVADGMLSGRRRDRQGLAGADGSDAAGSFRLTGQQSWLYYARPLAPLDRVQYEFYYVPGDTEVHPSLGRLAFLLAPDGVQTHWIAQDQDRETCQLSDTNLLRESECQRSGRTLPLRANDWNSVSLQVTGNAVTIELNGALIFERPIGPDDDRRFGLFRDGAVETKVRHAVLTGDWPESVPATESEQLLALTTDVLPAEQRIQSSLLAWTAPGATPDFARDIMLLARNQSEEQAFETLRDWVLPNESHSDLRLYSKHGPVAPLAPADGSAILTREGEVLLPAWELVVKAQQLDRLDQIASTVSQLDDQRPADRLARDALQIMIHAAAGEDAAASARLTVLRDGYVAIVGEQSGPTSEHAALAALWGAAERPTLHAQVRTVLEAMTAHNKENKFMRPEPHFRELNDSWTNVAAARLADRELAGADGPESLSQWTLVATDTAPSRGLGLLPTSFRRSAGRLEHFPGQVHGQLLFQSPLTGKFEIVARGTFGRPSPLLVGYGMHAVAAIGDPYETLSAQLMRSSEKSSGFPVAELPEVSELRIAVDDTKLIFTLNGTVIREQSLTPHPDPWIAVQAYDPGGRGTLHSLAIEGAPTVPDEIRLLETAQLGGFRTEYFETITLDPSNERSAWQYLGEELVGRGFAGVGTKSLQSVLSYQRPLLEDGEFEFETYYVPGELEVHPCIGRTTFVINPEGPQLHLRTDAQYERSGLAPDNLSELPGALPAPLKQKDWNHVRVTLTGDRAALFINGAQVAEADVVDSPERRCLGLFRFANQTKCRVRNLIYRGNWPKSLPGVSEQELAGTNNVAQAPQ